jgi:hypothetical protein
MLVLYAAGIDDLVGPFICLTPAHQGGLLCVGAPENTERAQLLHHWMSAPC